MRAAADVGGRAGGLVASLTNDGSKFRATGRRSESSSRSNHDGDVVVGAYGGML